MDENLALSAIVLKLSTISASGGPSIFSYKDTHGETLLEATLQRSAAEVAKRERQTPNFRQLVSRRKETHSRALLHVRSVSTIEPISGPSIRFLDVSPTHGDNGIGNHRAGRADGGVKTFHTEKSGGGSSGKTV